MRAYDGLPPAALAFYQGLWQVNSKAYWEAHKPVWELQVLAPMQALLAEFDEAYGPFHRFRPYRETQFSKPVPVRDRGIVASHSMRKR
jgi:hypothetical protein